MIFGLQNIFKIQNGIRKFSKWFQVVDGLLGLDQEGYFCNKITYYTYYYAYQMMQQAFDYMILLFGKFWNLISIMKWILKISVIRKIFLKFL